MGEVPSASIEASPEKREQERDARLVLKIFDLIGLRIRGGPETVVGALYPDGEAPRGGVVLTAEQADAIVNSAVDFEREIEGVLRDYLELSMEEWRALRRSIPGFSE